MQHITGIRHCNNALTTIVQAPLSILCVATMTSGIRLYLCGCYHVVEGGRTRKISEENVRPIHLRFHDLATSTENADSPPIRKQQNFWIFIVRAYGSDMTSDESFLTNRNARHFLRNWMITYRYVECGMWLSMCECVLPEQNIYFGRRTRRWKHNLLNQTATQWVDIRQGHRGWLAAYISLGQHNRQYYAKESKRSAQRKRRYGLISDHLIVVDCETHWSFLRQLLCCFIQ